MGEIFGIVLAVIGVVIAIIALKKDHYSKPKEELSHLILQFEMTKTLSEKVQQEVHTYIENNSASEQFLFPGITFKKYLSMMKDNYNQSLTSEMSNNLKNLPLTKPNIESMTKSLETQFEALQQVQNLLKTLS